LVSFGDLKIDTVTDDLHQIGRSRVVADLNFNSSPLFVAQAVVRGVKDELLIQRAISHSLKSDYR
jgi:hypothetical protein